MESDRRYRIRLVPGLMLLPITLELNVPFKQAIPRWKEEIGQQIGYDSQFISLMNKGNGTDQIEDEATLLKQADNIIHVFCSVPLASSRPQKPLEPQMLRDQKERWNLIKQSHPFCDTERFGLAELICPDFIKTIVFDYMLINEPERVAKYINARAVLHNHSKAQEYKKKRLQGTKLEMAPPEIIDDFFLNKMTKAELKLLNEGRKIRRRLQAPIPKTGTQVSSEIILKLKFEDGEESELPQDIQKEEKITATFFNMLYVADLKRLILAMIDRPFVLKTVDGQQLHNTDLVSTSKLPQPTKEGTATIWTLPIWISFGTLDFKQKQKARDKDALYSPKTLRVSGLNSCNTIVSLARSIEGKLVQALPEQKLNLKLAADCQRVIEGFDLIVQIDQCTWLQLLGYKQLEAEKQKVESNLPNMRLESSLREMGISKFASSLEYWVLSFQVNYVEPVGREDTVVKIVNFSLYAMKQLNKYEDLLDKVVACAPEGFDPSIICDNFSSDFSRDRWNEERQERNKPDSKVKFPRSITISKVRSNLGASSVFKITQQVNSDAKSGQAMTSIYLSVSYPAEYFSGNTQRMEFQFKVTDSIEAIKRTLFGFVRLPLDLGELVCCEGRIKEGQPIFRRNNLILIQESKKLIDVAKQNITKYSNPVVEAMIRVKPNTVRLSAEQSFFIWKKAPGSKKIEALKKAITLEDLKDGDISLVDDTKESQDKLFEHLRITNDQNIELGDQEALPAASGDRPICLNLEIRVAAHEKEQMRSLTDTCLLNMLSVRRQYNKKISTENPKNEAFERRRTLTKEMIEALDQFPDQNPNDKDEIISKSESTEEDLASNPDETLIDLAFFGYSCHGPSYTIKEKLKKFQYSEIQAILSSILNTEAINHCRYAGNMRSPVHSGLHYQEAKDLFMGSIVFSNNFMSTSTDYETAEAFAVSKMYKMQNSTINIITMIEAYLTDHNTPQLTIKPKDARYEEQEVLALPGFQSIVLQERRQQLVQPQTNEKVMKRTFTIVEIPYQNHISKEVSDVSFIWFDSYQNPHELAYFQLLLPNRFFGVTTEEDLYQELQRTPKAVLILQGSLSYYFIPLLQQRRDISYKIKSIIIWTSMQSLEEKYNLINSIKGYGKSEKKVFYQSMDEVIDEGNRILKEAAVSHS